MNSRPHAPQAPVRIVFVTFLLTANYIRTTFVINHVDTHGQARGTQSGYSKSNHVLVDSNAFRNFDLRPMKAFTISSISKVDRGRTGGVHRWRELLAVFSPHGKNIPVQFW